MQDTKTNKILINVILDRSGSMTSTKGGTISGYNEYINGLRADKNSDYAVTLTQFDAPMATPELTVTYEARALADIPEFTAKDYEPRGNTPLYDAIGECVRRCDPKGRAVITLIITDGEENASTEFTKESIKALIKQKESEGWTFAFLGANIDSYAVGSSVGVSAMNTANYAQGNEQALYSNLAQASVMRATSYRTMGLQASVSMDFLNDAQRSAMAQAPPTSTTTGGRPTAPPRFPRKNKEPRQWAVKR